MCLPSASKSFKQLGTLDGTDAARLLYGLSAGLDRVSLAEVMRELDASRSAAVGRPTNGRRESPSYRPSATNCARRSKNSPHATRRYWRLERRARCVGHEIADAEAEATRLDRHARTLELAHALAPKWEECAAARQQWPHWARWQVFRQTHCDECIESPTAFGSIDGAWYRSSAVGKIEFGSGRDNGPRLSTAA